MLFARKNQYFARMIHADSISFLEGKQAFSAMKAIIVGKKPILV